MTTVVHPVVENANNQDARVVGLEEDAVATAGGHLNAWPEVVACTPDDRASNQSLHHVAKGIQLFVVWSRPQDRVE